MVSYGNKTELIFDWFCCFLVIFQVHIESGTSARHYETIKLGDSPVLRDVILNDTTQQIHVLTEQQVDYTTMVMNYWLINSLLFGRLISTLLDE